jgi:hypothetical protein
MVKITTFLTVFLNIAAFCGCGVYSAVEVHHRLIISRTFLVEDEEVCLSQKWKYISDPSGRAVWKVGLLPLACRDWGFEYRRRHGCISVVSVVCFQVEISVTGQSLIQRPSECNVSECVREASKIRRSWPTRGCSAMGKYVLLLLLLLLLLLVVVVVVVVVVVFCCFCSRFAIVVVVVVVRAVILAEAEAVELCRYYVSIVSPRIINRHEFKILSLQ